MPQIDAPDGGRAAPARCRDRLRGAAGPDRGADARARARRGRAARRVRLGVRPAPRRPSVPAAARDRAGRLAVPVDDDRAPDDALHRAAGGRARALRVADLRAGGRRHRPAAAVRGRGRDAARRSIPKVFVPGPTFFEQLDVPALALQPQAIWPSTYSSAALAGADVVPYASFERGDAPARHPLRPDVPVLGRDRRHRAPPRAVERRVRRRRARGARRARPRPRHRRCWSPPITVRSTSARSTSSTRNGRR